MSGVGAVFISACSPINAVKTFLSFPESLVWSISDANRTWVQACLLLAISRFSIKISANPLDSSTLRDSGFRDGDYVVTLKINEDFDNWVPSGECPVTLSRHKAAKHYEN